MTDKLKIEVPGAKELTIKLIKEVAKKWEIKDGGKKELVDSKVPTGEKNYIRNDAISLENLLGRFDSRKYQVRDWKTVISIRKKLYNCYIKDLNEVTFSEEEASFLKRYLNNLVEKEGKDAPFNTFDLQTFFYLQEVLGE
jgi:hypothetical protein